jgi:hypothetical protein
MSRLPHFVNNRLTDGGEVISITSWPPFTDREIPSTHFFLRQSRFRRHILAGRIRLIEKSNNLIGNYTHDLPACNIVPQLTTLSRAPKL